MRPDQFSADFKIFQQTLFRIWKTASWLKKQGYEWINMNPDETTIADNEIMGSLELAISSMLQASDAIEEAGAVIDEMKAHGVTAERNKRDNAISAIRVFKFDDENEIMELSIEEAAEAEGISPIEYMKRTLNEAEKIEAEKNGINYATKPTTY